MRMKSLLLALALSLAALPALGQGAGTSILTTVTGDDLIDVTPATNPTLDTAATIDTIAAYIDGNLGATTITSTSANALAVGANGATNPVFNVNAATASVATGVNITGAAAGGGVAVAAISSGSNEALTLNAKGTGTIGIGSVSTGAVTITPATTITGALTPTGGVVGAGGFTMKPSNINTCGIPPRLSTDGTDTTPAVTETFIAQVDVPANMTLTGVAIFNGSAVAGNVVVGLADSTGAPIAAAKSASTAQSGTDAFQRIPFATPYAAKGPASYFVQVQFNNTSARLNTVLFGNCSTLKQTGQVFDTLTSFTPPTTFTASVGPYAGLY